MIGEASDGADEREQRSDCGHGRHLHQAHAPQLPVIEAERPQRRDVVPRRPELPEHGLGNEHQGGEGDEEGEDGQRDGLRSDGMLDLGRLVTQIGDEDVSSRSRELLGQGLGLPTELQRRHTGPKAHVGPVEASIGGPSCS